MQSLGQVQKKGSHALFRSHAAEKQHHAMVAHDLSAHDLVKHALQLSDLHRKPFQIMEGDHAHRGILQRYRIAGMPVCADAVQAQQLA